MMDNSARDKERGDRLDRTSVNENSSGQRYPNLIIGFAMLAVGLVAGYIGRGAFGPEANATRATATAEIAASQTMAAAEMSAAETRAVANAEVMQIIVSQTRHFKGQSDAPVTLIEFSDFKCGYCAKWAADAGRQIEDTFVADGKVRIGFFQFPILSEESMLAAEASECAADQDKFWEYHDALFLNQSDHSSERLKSLAVETGLNGKNFDECLDSGKNKTVVEEQKQVAQQIGVQSTPSFLMNSVPIMGAQPFDVFQRYIEQLLK